MIERGIYEIIKNECGGRVFMARASQNAMPPFAVVQRIDQEKWRSINNPSGIGQVTLQVDVYGSDYWQSKDNAKSIDDLLDGYRGIVYYGDSSPQSSVRVAGVSTQSNFDTLDQTEEPFLYRNTTRYLVTYEE